MSLQRQMNTGYLSPVTEMYNPPLNVYDKSKTVLLALCDSNKCLREVNPETKLYEHDWLKMIIKPHAKYTDVDCPDCGSALFWKRERPKCPKVTS